MFNRIKSTGYQAKRLALEKAGKATATQEGEVFNSKITSLQQTDKAFKTLQKVGKSVFASVAHPSDEEPPQKNPADEFLVEIKEVNVLKKTWNQKRLAMDTAKERAHAAAESAKIPGKNQDKKDKAAEVAKEDETAKIAEYEAAKDSLMQGIQTLESNRTDKFQSSIQAMTGILNAMQPEWTITEGSNSQYSPEGVGVVVDDEKKEVGQIVTDDAPQEVDNIERAATDSESD